MRPCSCRGSTSSWTQCCYITPKYSIKVRLLKKEKWGFYNWCNCIQSLNILFNESDLFRHIHCHERDKNDSRSRADLRESLQGIKTPRLTTDSKASIRNDFGCKTKPSFSLVRMCCWLYHRTHTTS